MTLPRLLPALVARLRARCGAAGLFSWSGWRRAEQDVQRELDLHLELETQQNIEQGMSPEDAMRAARAALGSVPLIREDVRAAWRWRWLDQLLQDVRCGARSLRRSFGFTAMSVATLALTIGATTAIFSVVYGILLRPLPVTEPDRLFRVLDIGYIGQLLELRERARTFDVSAYRPPDHGTLTGSDEPLRISVVQVTGDVLARLGRTPALGPGFRLDDERPGAAPAAVLSHNLWRRRFGADPAAVGRMLTLDGVAYQVRGVMPADFEFPSAGVDLWVPMTVDAASPVALWARDAVLIGRIRPGATLEGAAEEVRALAPQFARLFPWRMPDGYGTSVRLRTWRDDRLGEVRPMLFLLAQHVGAIDEMSLVVQSNADSRLITQSLQAAVAALDLQTPVSGIRAMDDIMAHTVSRPRFTTLLVLGFAVLGLVLGMVGVYGVVAYAAARQRRDIGIRLALGATRARIRARFVRRALLFAGAGVVIGELAAAVVMSSLSALLFGVSPWDPFTYAAVPALFVVLAGLAAYVPARRATGVDPALVLRAE